MSTTPDREMAEGDFKIKSRDDGGGYKTVQARGNTQHHLSAGEGSADPDLNGWQYIPMQSEGPLIFYARLSCNDHTSPKHTPCTLTLMHRIDLNFQRYGS